MGKKIGVGIVGGTGYTGVELLRLLVQHPKAEIRCVTSRAEAGSSLTSVYPSLRGFIDLDFSVPDNKQLAECDLVFFATPNGVAMKQVPDLLANGVRVIDLAADFRLQSVEVWQRWYQMEHACPALLDQAIYGLPELNRERIRGATLVANPGCYATAMLLGLLPLMEERANVCLETLVADGKSGASGAGRKANTGLLLSEIGESFSAYSASGHRHSAEVEQGLSLRAKTPVNLTFVPHLVPMSRGIEVSLYAKTDLPLEQAQELFLESYQSEEFVDVMAPGQHPATGAVRGTNLCRISLHRQAGGPFLIVSSVIDNLVKGAAGQAVQNFNLMFGLDESTALLKPGMLP